MHGDSTRAGCRVVLRRLVSRYWSVGAVLRLPLEDSLGVTGNADTEFVAAEYGFLLVIFTSLFPIQFMTYS